MDGYLVPTLLFAAALAWAGWRQRLPAATAVPLGITAAAPALLYAGGYLHLYDEAPWFVELRALPGSELLAALAAWPAGAALAHPVMRRSWLRAPVWGCLGLVLAVPYLKPLLLPLDAGELAERWDADVCLQSTGSTCGPASAATVLRRLGIAAGEAELARACHTAAGGTEAWFLVRELRRRGLRVTVRSGVAPSDIRAPAIAGVRSGATGHFIAILAAGTDGLETGDPMLGPRHEAPSRSRRIWTGFVMEAAR